MKQAKVLTDKELKKVTDYIDAFDRHAHRNRVIVLLTHYCGMRISDVKRSAILGHRNDHIK
jgi:integrase